MKLWLDDVRDPVPCGALGFVWVKTVEEAIALLKTGAVTFASLDHDLSPRASVGFWDGEQTGYDVVLWMEKHGVWPRDGVCVHSLNFEGRRRMVEVVQRAGCRLVDSEWSHEV